MRGLQVEVRDQRAEIGAGGRRIVRLAGQLVVDLFLLGAGAAQHATGAAVVVDGAGVVVAELHHDPVAALDERLGALPVAAAAIGAAGESAHGAVDDVDLVANDLQAPAGYLIDTGRTAR